MDDTANWLHKSIPVAKCTFHVMIYQFSIENVFTNVYYLSVETLLINYHY